MDKEQNKNQIKYILENGYVMARIINKRKEKEDYYVFEKKVNIKNKNKKEAA